MLATVEFHDDPGLKADKIGNIAVERNLAAEFEIAEAASAQGLPEFGLRVPLRMLRAKPRRRDGWRWRMAGYNHGGRGGARGGLSERADPLSCEN